MAAKGIKAKSPKKITDPNGFGKTKVKRKAKTKVKRKAKTKVRGKKK